MAVGHFEAVVFDFDGVIIDTEDAGYRAWRAIFREHGGDLDIADYAVCIGTRNAIDWPALLEERTGHRATLAELQARRNARPEYRIDTLPALAGVTDWLDAAEAIGLPIAMATSSERWWIAPHLERFGWTERFRTVATWDGPDCGRAPKPAPDLYLAACHELGVAPERAIAIEDSHNGLIAAKTAGLTCVAVPTPLTSHLDFSRADLVIDSLASISLTDALAALSTRH